MFFRKKATSGKPPPPSILETPLYWFSEHDPFLMRDAMEGVLILGGTGSGKSSGSGRALILEYLGMGFGGLVLCAKIEERKRWEEYARATGRTDDVVIISPESGLRFNFLEYMANSGKGASYTENIVNVLVDSMTNVNRQGSGDSGGDQSYFINASKQIIRNCIDLIKLAAGNDGKIRLSLAAIYDVIRSAPRSVDDMKGKEWLDTPFGEYVLAAQANIANNATSGNPANEHDYRETISYFENDYARLPEKTRQSVISTFTSSAEPLTRGKLHELFSSGIDVTPEDAFEGKILIIDYPVKEWLFAGIFIQIIFKTLFQQAAERRHITETSRPVIMSVDECQYFMTENDLDFLTTARPSRICSIFMTQNISNLYAKLKNKELVDAILAVLSTKIFHANNDTITNKWLVDSLGQYWAQTHSASTSRTPEKPNDATIRALTGWGQSATSSSSSTSETRADKIEMDLFSQLRKGGAYNEYKVDGIITQSGKIWNHTQDNWMICEFSQL